MSNFLRDEPTDNRSKENIKKELSSFSDIPVFMDTVRIARMLSHFARFYDDEASSCPLSIV